MIKTALHILSILGVLVLMQPLNAADIDLSGELGVDLDIFSFDRSFKDTLINRINDTLADTTLPRSSYTNRSLSNHYLKLNFAAPVVNKNFATFSGQTAVFGTYYNVKTDEDNTGLESTDRYFSPKLHSYNGNFLLFPTRTYPLHLYLSKAFNRSIRYESNNRADVDLSSPGLQVLRRYDSELRSRGARWKYTPRQGINFVTEYLQNKTQISRGYDFSENRNIWIDTTHGLIDPTVDLHNVDFINLLPDSVDIIIDGIPITILGPHGSPGASASLSVESGEHIFEISPFNRTIYNSLQVRTLVRGAQTWKITYNDPAAPNDIIQKLTAASAKIDIESIENLKNETRYDYTAIDESIQGLVSYIGNLNNMLRYDFSRLNNLQILTTYTKNRTQIDTLFPQINHSFLNQTMLSLAKRKGLSTSISHSITGMSSITPSIADPLSLPADTLKSTTHILMGRISFDLDRFNYSGDLKNSATFLSDSTHFSVIPTDTILVDDDVTDSIPPVQIIRDRLKPSYHSNQFGSVYTSKFDFGVWLFNLQPRHEIKYSKNKQKNPDQNSSEWENRFSLFGDVEKLIGIDKIKFKGEYSHRKRTSLGQQVSDNSREISTGIEDIKNKYLVDFTMTHNFTKKYRLMFLMNYERETFGNPNSSSDNARTIDVARQPVDKLSFKIDCQANPVGDIMVGASYAVITQKTKNAYTNRQTGLAELIEFTPNTIKRYGLSLIATIPKVNIPVRSFLMSESRLLRRLDSDRLTGDAVIKDDPAQIQTSLETRTSYRFRKITLTLMHTFKYENLRNEKYSYHEIRGAITRMFDLL